MTLEHAPPVSFSLHKRLLRPDEVPHGRTTALGFHPDGKRLISAHMWKAAQRTFLVVWDLDTGAHRVMGRQMGVVQRIGVLPDGRLVTASRPQGDDPGVVCFWAPSLEGQPLEVWTQRVMWWDFEARRAVLRDSNWHLQVRDLGHGEVSFEADAADFRHPFHDPFAASPVAGANGVIFVPGNAEALSLRFDPADNEPEPVRWTLDFDIDKVSLSGDAALAAFVGFDDELEVRDARTGALKWVLTQSERPAVSEAVRFAQGHDLLVVPYEDGGVSVWSMKDGQQKAALPSPPDLHTLGSVRGPANRLGWSPQGHLMLTHMDQHLHLGDFDSGQWVGVWEEPVPIISWQWSAAELLAVGNQDGEVVLVSS